MNMMNNLRVTMTI